MNKETVLIIIGLIVVGLPGAINTIGSAVEKIAKAKKAVEAPNAAQDAEIAELKRRMDKVERNLENDKSELESIQEGNHAIFRALLALLDHGLDGNNVRQMEEAKSELTIHLTNK